VSIWYYYKNFFTMHGHLNFNSKQTMKVVEQNTAFGSSFSALPLSVVANLKEAAVAPQAPVCRLCQISDAVSPLSSPLPPNLPP